MIRFDPTDAAMRSAIANAVNEATRRNADELGDKIGAATSVAHAAAEAAVSLFAGYIGAELAMIRAHAEAQMRAIELRPPAPLVIRMCRECGCTENRACVTDDGPCGWAEPDLCTACADEPAQQENTANAR